MKRYIGTGTTGGGINWVGDLATVNNASLVLSYNLAVGGASIDNSIINTNVEDMASQVGDFESAYSTKPASAPWSSENAVFGFWIGINEYCLRSPLLVNLTFKFAVSVGLTRAIKLVSWFRP